MCSSASRIALITVKIVYGKQTSKSPLVISLTLLAAPSDDGFQPNAGHTGTADGSLLRKP